MQSMVPLARQQAADENFCEIGKVVNMIGTGVGKCYNAHVVEMRKDVKLSDHRLGRWEPHLQLSLCVRGAACQSSSCGT